MELLVIGLALVIGVVGGLIMLLVVGILGVSSRESRREERLKIWRGNQPKQP